ncbi:MAG TPA: type II toxin-antitoxin system RelE/ParE family toxin [Crinalium sp.]
MTYRVEFSKRAANQLKSLSRHVQVRLKPAIDGLAEEPRPDGVVKLKGEENAYRVRVGDYRIVYEVRDNVLLVLIVKIGHRREIYRK